MYEVNNYLDDILTNPPRNEMKCFKGRITCWDHIRFNISILKLNPNDPNPHIQIYVCEDLLERDVKSLFCEYFRQWFTGYSDNDWIFEGFIPVEVVIDFINNYGGVYSID